MIFTLQRTYYPDRTEGQLFKDGSQVCVTMELPWEDNEPDRSCIPEAKYFVTAYSSPAHPNVWRVNNVPGRSDVLIHNGNFASDLGRTDTLGCILVGDTYGTIEGQPAVLDSVNTLNKLRATLPDSFYLTISGRTS